MSKNYKLILSSERVNIREVEPFIKTVPECAQLEESKYYNMMIAVTEAVNNAIVHGNKCDPRKTVELHIETVPGDIHITVKDQGEGFDPDTIGDPRSPENLLREGGRGIFLISSLIDGVDFHRSDEGMIIKMKVAIE